MVDCLHEQEQRLTSKSNRCYAAWIGLPAAEIAGRRIIDVIGQDFSKSGAVDGWVACVIDVTAREKAEDSLSIAHSALARLFELSVMPGGAKAMPDLLQAVIDTAIDVTDADKGNLQLFDEDSLGLGGADTQA